LIILVCTNSDALYVLLTSAMKNQLKDENNGHPWFSHYPGTSPPDEARCFLNIFGELKYGCIVIISEKTTEDEEQSIGLAWKRLNLGIPIVWCDVKNDGSVWWFRIFSPRDPFTVLVENIRGLIKK